MAARHLKQARTTSRVPFLVAGAFVAVAVAAGIGTVALHVTDGSPRVAREAASAPAVPQSLSQEGRLVAVSPTSVTAQSADGFARTYLVDAQTNAITTDGSLVGRAGTAFAVNDEVAIVGVVRNGTAVATAVADRDVSNLDGPPMDAVGIN